MPVSFSRNGSHIGDNHSPIKPEQGNLNQSGSRIMPNMTSDTLSKSNQTAINASVSSFAPTITTSQTNETRSIGKGRRPRRLPLRLKNPDQIGVDASPTSIGKSVNDSSLPSPNSTPMSQQIQSAASFAPSLPIVSEAKPTSTWSSESTPDSTFIPTTQIEPGPYYGSGRHIQENVLPSHDITADINSSLRENGVAKPSNIDRGWVIGILVAVVLFIILTISGIGLYMYRLRHHRHSSSPSKAKLSKILRSATSSTSKSTPSESHKGWKKFNRELKKVEPSDMEISHAFQQEQSVLASDSPWLQWEAPCVEDLYVSLSRQAPSLPRRKIDAIINNMTTQPRSKKVSTSTLNKSNLTRPFPSLQRDGSEMKDPIQNNVERNQYSSSHVPSILSKYSRDDDTTFDDDLTSSSYISMENDAVSPNIAAKIQAAPPIQYQKLTSIAKKEWEHLLLRHPSLESLKEFVAGSDTQSIMGTRDRLQSISSIISRPHTNHRYPSGPISIRNASISTHSSYAPIHDFYDEVFAGVEENLS